MNTVIAVVSKQKQFLVVVALAGFLIVVAALVLPTLVCYTDLREIALRRALSAIHMSGECKSLAIGWVSPLSLSGLRLQAANGTTFCEIESLRSEITLAKLLFGTRDLGKLDVERSTLHLFVGEGAATWELLRGLEAGQAKESVDKNDTAKEKDRSPVALELHLRDARLVVHEYREDRSIADVSGVDLDVVIGMADNEPELSLRLLKPLSNLPVTPELCRAGLRYATPVLAVATWTRGMVTLDLQECVVPLRNPPQARARGTLILHNVEAGLQDALLRTATKEIASITGRSLPTSIHLARESEVQFSLADRRIHHTGLAIGLPNVSAELLVRSEGSVGLDETVELDLEVPLPFALLGRGPLAQTLGNQTLHMPVRGTLSAPHVSFEGDGRLVSDLFAKLLGGGTAVEGGPGLGQATPEGGVPPTIDATNNATNNGAGGEEQADAAEEILEAAGEVADILKKRWQERRARNPDLEGEAERSPRWRWRDRRRDP